MAGRTTLKEYLARVKEFFVEGRDKDRRQQQDRRSEERPAVADRRFQVVIHSRFPDSLERHKRIFPDLNEKLKRFIDIKQADPLRGKYGKHDSPFTTGSPLAGYNHCHLRDDAILIYTMKNQSINLWMICNHAEIEGKGMKKTAAALATSTQL